MFKLMYNKDWNYLLKELNTYKSFGQQVNFLAGKLINGGAQELFNLNEEPALQTYLNNPQPVQTLATLLLPIDDSVADQALQLWLYLNHFLGQPA